MDNFELYQQFCSLYNTHQAGFFRPDRDFAAALHETSLTIFNKLGGKLEKTQKIKDMLMPFQRMANIAVLSKPAFDYIPKPKDYVWFSDMEVVIEDEKIVGYPGCDFIKEDTCTPYKDLEADFFPATSSFNKHPIHLIKDGKWTSVTSHITRGPSVPKRRMYCRTIEEGFEIAPKGVGVCLLSYYRLPKKPTINYNTRVVGPDTYLDYIPGTSEQLEWNDNMVPVFLYMMGKRFGLTTKSELEIQVSQMDPDLLV